MCMKLRRYWKGWHKSVIIVIKWVLWTKQAPDKRRTKESVIGNASFIIWSFEIIISQVIHTDECWLKWTHISFKPRHKGVPIATIIFPSSKWWLHQQLCPWNNSLNVSRLYIYIYVRFMKYNGWACNERVPMTWSQQYEKTGTLL